MGNNNSVCCAPGLGIKNVDEQEMPFKIGQTERTDNTSLSATNKGGGEEMAYSSFSSISTNSSKNSNPYTDKQTKDQCPIPEMRNDADWYNSLSDEIRVAVSSYDEATTEAVNQYYGN